VYRCKKGHTFELFHSMKDDAPKRCPKCRSRAVRVPSAGAGLLFKGSGFYITDYRSSSYQEKAKQEKSGASSSDAAKGGGKSEGGPKSGGGSKSEGGAKSPSAKPASGAPPRKSEPRSGGSGASSD
jgi:putative FmdB family regulatory protein